MSRATIDRRRFLGSAAATAAFFAARDAAARQDAEPPRSRLLALELQAGAPLAAMKAFYGKTLDLAILEESADRFTVEAGETQLTFVESPSTGSGPSPSYRFAFNLPENKIREALEWQRPRTPLLSVPEAQRASGYPPEVAEERRTNSHSFAFNDPAGNRIEYVARHDLKNGNNAKFGWADLLYVSEIALAVDDVAGAAEKLAGATGLGRFKDTAAIGDEHGMLVLTKRGQDAGVFRTGITLRSAEPGKYELPGYPYQLVLEPRCSCA